MPGGKIETKIFTSCDSLNFKSKSFNYAFLQVLYRATTIFRSQHFSRHDKVREEIGKKVRTLKALKNHQLKELEYLIEMKKELQQTAEKLAERYEDIKDHQLDLARRYYFYKSLFKDNKYFSLKLICLQG